MTTIVGALDEDQIRANGRYRRLLLTGMTSVGARAVSVVNVLISVPLALAYLGTERYGLWMTVTSFIALLNFADLGLGNGLINAISEANGKDDREAARRYVSTAFFSLIVMTLSLLGVFLIIYPHVQWDRFFSVSSQAAVEEVGPAFMAVMICLALSLPAGIVTKTQLGYQEGFFADIWTAAGNLLSLAAVLLAIHFRARLAFLVLALVGVPLVATIANGYYLFGISRTWLCPHIKYFDREACRKIFRLGGLFFALQLAITVGFSSDNIVAARVLGPSAVTQYAVPMKLFSAIPVLLGMFLNPLWPAYGEAIARKDFFWVRSAFKRSILLVLLFAAIPAAGLVLLGPMILNYWVGPVIKPTFELLLGMALWTVVSTMGSAVGMLLNGANVIRFQVILASVMAVAALVSKTILASFIGVPGIIWGTLLAYLLCSGIPTTMYGSRLLADMGKPGKDA